MLDIFILIVVFGSMIFIQYILNEDNEVVERTQHVIGPESADVLRNLLC